MQRGPGPVAGDYPDRCRAISRLTTTFALGVHTGHYSLVSEWFRSHDWSTDAPQDFETRLGRARAHNRAQYLRIKALALIDAGNLDAATALLHRVVDDYGDDWIQVTASHEHLGDIYRSKGDLAGAETKYRRVLMLPLPLHRTVGHEHNSRAGVSRSVTRM
jgi:hypothetical protein